MKRAFLTLIIFTNLSCHRLPPGQQVVPPGVRARGGFVDICPRWSHDARHIAFLRKTADRKLQLFIASADLQQVRPMTAAEVVLPDREFDCGKVSTNTPDNLEWSPDDREIVVPRIEWFTFEDGQRLPGTGLWACAVDSSKMRPLAVHPSDYKGWMYYYRAPAWSPDGKRLAWLGCGWGWENGLFVRTLAGTQPDNTYNRFDRYDDAGFPAWSPDGRYLAFRHGILRALTANRVETVEIREPAGNLAKTVFTSGGNGSSQNTSGLHPIGSSDAVFPRINGLAWSPDSFNLAVSTSNNTAKPGMYNIWKVRVDDGISHWVGPGDPSGARGLGGLIWLNSRMLAGIRNEYHGYSAMQFKPGEGEPHFLVRLASDDIDWSPDRHVIVCAPHATGHMDDITTLQLVRTRL